MTNVKPPRTAHRLITLHLVMATVIAGGCNDEPTRTNAIQDMATSTNTGSAGLLTEPSASQDTNWSDAIVKTEEVSTLQSDSEKTTLGEKVDRTVDAAREKAEHVAELGEEKARTISSKGKSALDTAAARGSEIADSAAKKAKELAASGTDAAEGLIERSKDAAQKGIDAARSTATRVISKADQALNSPAETNSGDATDSSQ